MSRAKYARDAILDSTMDEQRSRAIETYRSAIIQDFSDQVEDSISQLEQLCEQVGESQVRLGLALALHTIRDLCSEWS